MLTAKHHDGFCEGNRAGAGLWIPLGPARREPLLNVPPDRRGLLDERARKRLLEMRCSIEQRLANPLASNWSEQDGAWVLDYNSPAECDHLQQEDIARPAHPRLPRAR